MPFKKGDRANPGGRPKEKVFADAVRLAVSRVGKDGLKKLHRIAEKLVECALNGESWAIQHVADRLDGKPAQESMVTVDDKRDATDWTRDELVAFLDEQRESRQRTAAKNGSGGEPDSVH